MRIAHITPGAGNMICGSCFHDNTLAAELIRQGHDVSLIPIYTPIRTEEDSVSIDRVFYGAINVYLEQKSALFRHTPRALDRLLNTPQMLNWAASRSSTIDARALGALALSVLQGEEGKQSKELDQLVAWLRDDLRPEIVHLSNSMLLGMARRIRSELGVPVLCSVQGEDIFLDELAEPYLGRVRQVLRERSRDVDGFVATSRYYVDFMADLLDVPVERIHHVPLGLNLAGFADVSDLAPREDRPFTIGYLARICPEKGCHLLVEAVRDLVKDVGKDSVRLRIAGYLGARDREYFDGILDRVRAWQLDDVIEHVGELDRPRKQEFLASLDVLSVPTTYREPKGLFVLESLASGVPVVQPSHGAFPELLEATGGGELFEPGSPAALTHALRRLRDDPRARRELGRNGRRAVHEKFSDRTMAERTLAVYRRYRPAAGTS